MSETSNLDFFTNRAMLIHATEMEFQERREAFTLMLEEFRIQIKKEAMDAANDGLNEETFNKLRLAEGQ